jgi:hypothetical protein
VCFPNVHVLLGHEIWCPNCLWCNTLLPPCQQSVFFFRDNKMKRLWHDSSSFSSPGNKTWTKCESINLNYLPSGRNSRCHTSLLCHEVGRAKRNGKFWCEIKIVCIAKNIFPNHGIVWEAIEWPRRSFPWSWTLYKLGVTWCTPNSLKDSNVSPKLKRTEGKGVGAHSLARSIIKG